MVNRSFSQATRTRNELVAVIAVSVYHRVHHTFPHRHSDPMPLIFVESGLFRGVENGAFGPIDAL